MTEENRKNLNEVHEKIEKVLLGTFPYDEITLDQRNGLVAELRERRIFIQDMLMKEMSINHHAKIDHSKESEKQNLEKKVESNDISTPLSPRKLLLEKLDNILHRDEVNAVHLMNRLNAVVDLPINYTQQPIQPPVVIRKRVLDFNGTIHPPGDGNSYPHPSNVVYKKRGRPLGVKNKKPGIQVQQPFFASVESDRLSLDSNTVNGNSSDLNNTNLNNTDLNHTNSEYSMDQ
ncbi:hypothetical protein HDV02_004240 [Globomyces sp. JEL0801]|nr:hypothetical protein HDV02_004240 [Globomyces sp. JEL0801]